MKKVFKNFVLLLISTSLVSCLSDPLSYDDVLDSNWEFTILRDAECTKIYSKDSGWSFNGDGYRYHAYKYENASYVTSALRWTNDSRSTIFAPSLKEACDQILDAI